MLPQREGGWVCVSPDGLQWSDRGTIDGWIPVPAEFAHTDTDLLSVVGELVGLKLASVRRAEAAAAKLAAIDSHRAALIAGGFPYAGHQFALTTDNKVEILALQVFAAALPYPVSVTALDETAVLLADAAAVGAYAGAALSHGLTVHGTAAARRADVATALADPDATAGLASVLAVTTDW